MDLYRQPEFRQAFRKALQEPRIFSDKTLPLQGLSDCTNAPSFVLGAEEHNTDGVGESKQPRWR